ncbi:MAG: UTP--glucose-1-phosphate uridylyltransferase [Verrucomicrobiales bacterium]|jgi:UTP--glucose-1-phosphate uridylyltransferase
MPVTKAVIPAAGFGTRFLPATKSQPKEMLPIVDTPTIQYVVEEATASGITDILMVIGKSKRAIEEHFYRNFELETELSAKGKLEELAEINKIADKANIHFVWQKELNGLGDAVSYARDHVGKEPFVLLLGDTLISSNHPDRKPITRQMLDIYDRYEAPVVGLEEVERSKVERYGIIGGTPIDGQDGLFQLDQLVEKPPAAEAPSNLAIAGRYIFTADIFDHIANTKPGKNGEIQLTDAMAALLKERDMYGLRFDGTRYDIGNKLDFLKTNVVFGLAREDLGADFKKFILEIAEQLKAEG